ncbi:MAG: hypothetical protein ABII12_02950 [Planctomycetota bacterium]
MLRNGFPRKASAAVLSATAILICASPVTGRIIAPPSAECAARHDAKPLDAVPDFSLPPNAEQVRLELAGLLAMAERPPARGESRERHSGPGDRGRSHERAGERHGGDRPPPPQSRGLFTPFDEEDDFECGGPHEHPKPHGPEHPDPAWHEAGPMKAFLMALDNLDDLINFYEEQDRIEDTEQALQKRVELSMKLAELQALAQHVGPDAAIREYYRYVNRPDRALEHDLRRTEQEIQETTRLMGDLHAGIARLTSRHETLEQHRQELAERREHLHAQLLDLHSQREAEHRHELELSAKRIPDEAAWLADEIEAIKKALAGRRVGEERRSRLEDRRADLSREMRDLKGEQAEVRAALEHNKKEAAQRRERQRREEAAGLREELRRLDDQKWEIQAEQSRTLQWMDQRAAEIEGRMEEIKTFLRRAADKPKATPKSDKPRAPSKPGKAKAPPKPDKAKGAAPPGKNSQSAKEKRARPTEKKSHKPQKAKPGEKEKAKPARKPNKTQPKAGKGSKAE